MTIKTSKRNTCFCQGAWGRAKVAKSREYMRREHINMWKSSLMHMCIKKLEKEKKTKCLIFNGWLFESYSDAKSALLNSILDAIDEEMKLTDKGKKIISGLYKSVDKLQLAQKAVKFGTNWLLTGGVGALMGLTTDAVISMVQTKVPELAGKIDPSSDKSSILQVVKDE